MIKTLLLITLPILYFNSMGQNDLLKETAYSLSEKYNYSVSKLAEGNYSHPQWSQNGEYISCTNKEFSGIMVMNKENNNIKILCSELGAGYKYSWSLDNTHISYRGSRFEDNKRVQFIGVIDFVNTSETVLTFQNRLQPPVWNYSEKGKRASYVINNEVHFSDYFAYESEKDISLSTISNINTFLYYKEGILYIINNNTLNENTKQVQGMDPVISPDRKHFIFSKKDQLYLGTFNSETEIGLGFGIHPSWSPDSKQIVYQKTKDNGHVITESDLFIMDIETLTSYPLTNTTDLLEANPSWSPDGKGILFNDENVGNIYIISFK